LILDENINKVELVKIIRSLISFIVIDGKDFVKEEQKEAYIKKYLYKLSKSMNGANDYVNVNTIWKIVEKDTLSLIEKEKLSKK